MSETKINLSALKNNTTTADTPEKDTTNNAEQNIEVSQNTTTDGGKLKVESENNVTSNESTSSIIKISLNSIKSQSQTSSKTPKKEAITTDIPTNANVEQEVREKNTAEQKTLKEEKKPLIQSFVQEEDESSDLTGIIDLEVPKDDSRAESQKSNTTSKADISLGDTQDINTTKEDLTEVQASKSDQDIHVDTGAEQEEDSKNSQNQSKTEESEVKTSSKKRSKKAKGTGGLHLFSKKAQQVPLAEQEVKIKKEETLSEDPIHFTNYNSSFDEQREKLLKKIKKIKYTPKTNKRFIGSLVAITILSISGLIYLNPEIHNIENYSANLFGSEESQEQKSDQITTNTGSNSQDSEEYGETRENISDIQEDTGIDTNISSPEQKKQVEKTKKLYDFFQTQ